MTLAQCKVGDKVKICGVNAGYKAELNLVNLGVGIGHIIEVGKKAIFGGPIIVIYQDTEIAIGLGLAKKILVEKF